jgi:hypothetical protein
MQLIVYKGDSVSDILSYLKFFSSMRKTYSDYHRISIVCLLPVLEIYRWHYYCTVSSTEKINGEEHI